MTGGGHGNYITNRKFDYNKWRRRMDLYRTSAIKSAVAAGVRDGTVLMANMLDEPNHPDWGGVITKATLDKMASYVKGIFPTLPAGVSIRWDWRPNERYTKVDFIQTQYVTRFGSAASWRNQAMDRGEEEWHLALVCHQPNQWRNPDRELSDRQDRREGNLRG